MLSFTVLSALYVTQQADTPPTSSKPMASCLQQIAIERAMVLPENIENLWWRYAMYEDSTRDDCCSWRFVLCEDGIAIGVVFFRRWGITFFIDISFLPSIVQYLHISECNMRSFALRGLPRDARYVYFGGVRYPVMDRASSLKDLRKDSHIFNTADLPRNLEEAYFAFSASPYRSVVIALLPVGLRLLHIRNRSSIEKVFLGPEALPESLERLSVCRCNVFRHEKTKPPELIFIKSEGDDKPDSRVRMENGESTDALVAYQMQYFRKFVDLTFGD